MKVGNEIRLVRRQGVNSRIKKDNRILGFTKDKYGKKYE